MFALFHPLLLAKYVALYALCAAAAGMLWLFLPPDVLAERVPLQSHQSVTVGEVTGWFPTAMLGAAAATLVTGVACGLLNVASAATARALTAHPADGPAPPGGRVALARGVRLSFSALRIALMLAGIASIFLGMGLVWWNLVSGDLVAEITGILAAVGGGAGVATGAAFYRP